MDWGYFFGEITSNNLVVAVSAAAIAAVAVPWQYFKQKTIQDIDDEFVKKGINELKNYLHSQRIIVDHNYTVLIDIFRHFRDLDYDSFISQYDILKDAFDKSLVSAVMPVSSYKVSELLGRSDLFSKPLVSSIIEAHRLNSLFKTEAIMVLEKQIISKQEFDINKNKVDRAQQFMQAQLESKSYKKLHSMTLFLEKIEVEFRSKKFDDYKDVYNFKENSNIKSYLEKISR